jgi:phage repressor protein C with HTH and peptisase S24 domain
MNNTSLALENIPGSFDQFSALGRCDPKKLFMVQMPDDAMVGTFRCGELLIADSMDADSKFWWDAIYYYEFRGRRYVKRLQLTGTKLCVISDNKKYQTICFEKSMITEFNILGMIRFHLQRVC